MRTAAGREQQVQSAAANAARQRARRCLHLIAHLIEPARRARHRECNQRALAARANITYCRRFASAAIGSARALSHIGRAYLFKERLLAPSVRHARAEVARRSATAGARVIC